MYLFFFFFKQKTAYEMRISDWSSDVCSSDLIVQIDHRGPGALAALVLHPLPVIFAFMEIIVVRAEMLAGGVALALHRLAVFAGDAEQIGDGFVDRADVGRPAAHEIGRASCRERGCQDV